MEMVYVRMDFEFLAPQRSASIAEFVKAYGFPLEPILFAGIVKFIEPCWLIKIGFHFRNYVISASHR